MKKFSRCLFAFLFSLLVVFVSFPFPDIKAAASWDNIIYSIKANLGMVSIANGSLSALDNSDFYLSLYETPLVQNGVSFVPAQTFSSKGEWVVTCQNRGNPDVVGFTDFDIVQSLQDSGYIQKSSSGYDFSNIPKLGENFQNTQSPLDGVDVITNFGDFDTSFSELKRGPAVTSAYNSIKDYYLNNYDNLVIVKCKTSDSDNFYQYNFISFEDSDFVGLYEYGSVLYNTYFHNDSFHIVSYTPYLKAYTSISSQSYDNVGKGFAGSYYIPIPSSINFDSSIFNVDSSTSGVYRNNFSVWSNRPVVIGSTTTALQNYYYWLHSSPSGAFYTNANTGNVYSTEYIENNDWSQIYNNYITDVSNYYSTTENITNEQLSQYIDNSTTITNITNNYITNNNGSSGEDDIITNSWLERIYNKLVEIKSILLGRGDPDDNSDYITDNGIKNDILHAPASDLFPDVPLEDFISDSEDFTVDLFATKLSAVLTEAIPFCYIYILGEVADDLKASPSPPYWEIPFTIDRLNIDENLILDMTSSDWDSVHNVWIALFMIIFVSYLFYLSYRVIMLVSNLFA